MSDSLYEFEHVVGNERVTFKRLVNGAVRISVVGPADVGWVEVPTDRQVEAAKVLAGKDWPENLSPDYWIIVDPADVRSGDVVKVRFSDADLAGDFSITGKTYMSTGYVMVGGWFIHRQREVHDMVREVYRKPNVVETQIRTVLRDNFPLASSDLLWKVSHRLVAAVQKAQGDEAAPLARLLSKDPKLGDLFSDRPEDYAEIARDLVRQGVYAPGGTT